MPDECGEIIEEIKRSWVKCEILRLLRDNPFILDNLPGMSRWLAIAEHLVEPEVEELAAMRVLRTYGEGSGAVYGYTRDKEMRAYIDRRWPEIEMAREHLRKPESGGV